MKKILTFLLCALMLFSVCACGGKTGDKQVQLKYYSSGTDMIPALLTKKITVGLIAEPAATTLINKSNGEYSIKLDVQTLYGGSYPQAVIVAKKSVVQNDSEFITSLISALEENSSWITQNDENAKSAVDAINSVSSLTEAEQSLKKGIINKDVVNRCNVRFASAESMKTQIDSYINSVREIEQAAANVLPQEFYYAPASETTSNPSGSYTVVMPDGAPSLAVAKLIKDNNQFNRQVNYSVVSASVIASKVTSDKADVVIMPLTAASKTAAKNGEYVMLGVVTHGNLFIVSNGEISSLNDLNGKTVGVIGQGQVPDLTMKIILKNNNFNYSIAE